MSKIEKANSKLMRSAGFKPGYKSGIDTRVWERGDLRVAVGPQPMRLNRLIGYVIEQAAYRMRRSASLQFAGFKTDNKTGFTKADS